MGMSGNGERGESVETQKSWDLRRDITKGHLRIKVLQYYVRIRGFLIEFKKKMERPYKLKAKANRE